MLPSFRILNRRQLYPTDHLFFFFWLFSFKIYVIFTNVWLWITILSLFKILSKTLVYGWRLNVSYPKIWNNLTFSCQNKPYYVQSWENFVSEIFVFGYYFISSFSSKVLVEWPLEWVWKYSDEFFYELDVSSVSTSWQAQEPKNS